MIRPEQIVRAWFVKLIGDFKKRKRLRDKGLPVLTSRMVLYKNAAHALYLEAEREEDERAMVYYNGQIRVVDWLFGDFRGMPVMDKKSDGTGR